MQITLNIKFGETTINKALPSITTMDEVRNLVAQEFNLKKRNFFLFAPSNVIIGPYRGKNHSAIILSNKETLKSLKKIFEKNSLHNKRPCDYKGPYKKPNYLLYKIDCIKY